MLRKRKQKFEAANYNQNKDTNAYMIEIYLDNYAELFNGWDASPLRRRDLEPELLDFLEESGTEIPLNEKIELYLYLPEYMKDEEKEERSKIGIINNFKTTLFYINKSLKKIYRQMVTNIIMSLLFLTAAYIARNILELSDLFSTIFIEGIYIGGWVLLWEAFSLFFFDSYEIRQRKKIFLRFLDMEIYFKYIEK